MPKAADMSTLAAGLAEGSKPKAKPPRRSRRHKVDNVSVYKFKREGTMLRKTVYFSPQEWRAIEKAAGAEITSATTIIRRAVREALELA
jgi:hypothetical protein